MEKIYILKDPVEGFSHPEKIFNNIKKFNIEFSQENFIIFYLDTKNKIIDSEVLFKGGLNSCLIDPKTLFRQALIKNSNAVIIAHNHPSGDLNPSDEDEDVFKQLKTAGEIIQIKVLDFIIFNETQYYSLRRC